MRAKDAARHSRTLRHLNALRMAAQAGVSDSVRSATLACRAIGFCEHGSLHRQLSKKLQPQIDAPPQPGFWDEVVRGSHERYGDNLRQNPSLTRSIILKAPSANGEKGVLMIPFEYNWARLALGLSNDEFAWLNKRYDFALSCSWSPTDYATLSLILSKTSTDIFVQASNAREFTKIADFHPRIRLIPGISACDWINPDFYPNLTGERPIDFLMIANWGEFKRHWDFFNALRHLPATLRIVLVGQREGGRDAEFIRRQASSFGVPQNLEIHQSLPITEVTRLQTQSKVALIFSRREGGCVAFVEAMFAGCAVGIRADAHVGALAYVNENTGLLLRPGHLAEDLMTLLQMAGSLQPATWAAGHISCHHTHKKVNAFFRKYAAEKELPWTCDLATHHWRPYPAHTSQQEASALLSTYRELHDKFPKVFGAEFFAHATVVV